MVEATASSGQQIKQIPNVDIVEMNENNNFMDNEDELSHLESQSE